MVIRYQMIVGRIMVPKDVHVLIPKTCEYATLPGKMDFADMIRIKDLEMERLSWIIQSGPNLIPL